MEYQRLGLWSPTAAESTLANFPLVVVRLMKYQRLAVTRTSSRPRWPLRSCRLSPRTNRNYCCNRVISRLREAIFGSYPYPPVLRTISYAVFCLKKKKHTNTRNQHDLRDL